MTYLALPSLDTANGIVALLLGLAGLLALLAAYLRWVRPHLHSASRTWVAFRDTFLGRDAIKDSITGQERVPAVPPMGVRLANLETTVDALARQDSRVAHVESDVFDLKHRVAELENTRVETVITKLESAAMWQGVGALHDEDPGLPEPDETPDITD